MQLPESLRPWRQWLEWFAPEQLPVFADLLGRINPMLGPLRGQQQGGVPEPDGLGDLQRRGPYERLLSSEWLLAEEMPEEFLRRVAVGEHMFLAPQYRSQQANRLIVVLFDAGPLQLGAARLVHLALLMLLARRAEEAGAELRWGVLQHSPQLHPLQTSAQLKLLLNARTLHTVSDEHWQTWRSWLAEQQQNTGECWIVGQRLPKTDAQSCTHRVQVKRSLDGQSLSFELQSATSRRVSLPIPDERQALQLLNGQFDGEVVVAPVAKGSVPRVGLNLAPVISSAGTHVALKLLEGDGMVVIKLPAEHQKKPLDVRRQFWHAGREPLAATFNSRNLGAVLSYEHCLRFWNMSGFRLAQKPDREELHLPPGTARLLPMIWMRSRPVDRVYLLDNQGHLVYWLSGKDSASPMTPPAKAQKVDDNVLDMARVDQEVLVYVRKEGHHLFAHAVRGDGRLINRFSLGTGENVSKVLIAGSVLWRNYFGGCALLTVADGKEHWRISFDDVLRTAPQQVDLAPGWKGLGLIQERNSDAYSLVLLSPNRQAIAVHYDGQQHVLFTTTEAIVKVSFCPQSGQVAALTSARELLVYSVPSRRMRLQVFCDRVMSKNREGANA